MTKPTIIALDGHVLAMEACRELRDTGYRVIIIGDRNSDINPALSIKGIEGHALSSPVSNPENLVNEILDIGTKITGQKVLIPLNDTYCLWLAKYQRQINPIYNILSNDENLIKGLLDKWEQYKIVQNIGINVPVTYENIDKALMSEEIKYPVIVKPRYSYTTPDFRRMFGIKVITVRNREGLIRACNNLSNNGFEAIIQENVPGFDDSQYFYGATAKEGSVYSVCIAQKLKVDPSPNGSGMVIRTISDNIIKAYGDKILEGIQYSGICDIEFKRNEITGEIQFIEFNPRYGMGQKVMQLAGRSNTEMYVDLAMNKIPKETICGNPGYYWVYIDEWLKEKMMPWRNHRLRKMRNMRNTCRTFYFDDPIPELKHAMYLIKLKLKKIFKIEIVPQNFIR